jgi:hypothetical protein
VQLVEALGYKPGDRPEVDSTFTGIRTRSRARPERNVDLAVSVPIS